MITCRLVFLFFSIFSVLRLSAGMQSELGKKNYGNYCYDETIKTARVFVHGNELSYPAIELNGDDVLHISFDALANSAKDYAYQIIHCNADWSASELFSDEFMEGFNENRIYEYNFSINTKISFIHYKVLIPNDEVKLKVSGNYIFRLIEEGNRDKTVLTLRFSVFEPLVAVQAEIVRPLSMEKSENGQEVKLSVVHEQLTINNPFEDIKIAITQNNRPDNVITGVKPVFVRDNELVYSISGETIFNGGNEFHTINFSSIPKLGLNINDIRYVDSVYHVQTRLNERRSYRKYFWEEDMNGKYLVNLNESEDSWLSADYVYVHFNLAMPEPFLEGNVFVYGSFNNWLRTEKNQMTYNFSNKMYEATVLLKQGYYNYTYAYYNVFTNVLDDAYIEGSHFQTENDYIIAVYYRDFDYKYDRLIGYRVINSKYQQ